MESRLSTARSTSPDSMTRPLRLSLFGAALEHRREIANYGELDLSAQSSRRLYGDVGSVGALQSSGDAQISAFRLSNNNFPLTPRVVVTTEVGDGGVSAPQALRSMPRAGAVAANTRGVSQRWSNPEGSWEALWGAGKRGTQQDDPFNGFQAWPGTAFWAGSSVHFMGQGFAGAQVFSATTSARTLSSNPFARRLTEVNSPTPVRSLVAVAGWGDRQRNLGVLPELSGSVALVGSQRPGAPSPSGWGLLGQVLWQTGPRVLDASFHHVTPSTWVGDRPYINAGDGGTVRYAERSARHAWSLGLSANRIAPESAARQSLWSATADWRWRLGRDESLALNVKAGDQRALPVWSPGALVPPLAGGERYASVSARYQRPFAAIGLTTFALSTQNNQRLYAELPAATAATARWDQDWTHSRNERSRFTLRTSVAVISERSSARNVTTPSVALSANWRQDSRLSIDSEIRYQSPRSNLALESGISGSFGVSWRPASASNFTLGARIAANQSRYEPLVLLQAPDLVPFVRSTGWTGWLSVRYELAAGTAAPVLGLRRDGVMGAGELTGIVYFDENGDGIRQGSERGLPNAEIMLDGRTVARTDVDGRFRLPLVAVGGHRVQLRIESIPLPWESTALTRNVEIELRGEHPLEFPLTRIRD